MKIGASFPSRYLRACDLPEGSQVRVVIDRVEVENVAGTSDPDDEKPVLYFQGKNKGVVLNKTNSGIITQALGTDETEEWTGQAIIIYPTETQFGGKMVPCIRVRADKSAKTAPARNGGAAPRRMAIPQQQPAEAAPEAAEEFDDSSIPF